MDLQLKRFRNLRGLSQDEMAERLGVKTSRYGTWERGERTMSFQQAIACAEILGCTTDELAGRKPVRSFADPDQAALNGYFESMNERGRSALVESARLMSDGDSVRIEKDGAAHAGISSAMGA